MEFEFTNEHWVWLLPCFLMLCDVATGYLNALLKHDIKSTKMRAGIVKKASEIIVILIMEILTYAMNIPFDIVKWLSGMIIFTELNSVFENLDLMGIRIPSFIKTRINDNIDKIDKGE